MRHGNPNLKQPSALVRRRQCSSRRAHRGQKRTPNKQTREYIVECDEVHVATIHCDQVRASRADVEVPLSRIKSTTSTRQGETRLQAEGAQVHETAPNTATAPARPATPWKYRRSASSPRRQQDGTETEAGEMEGRGCMKRFATSEHTRQRRKRRRNPQANEGRRRQERNEASSSHQHTSMDFDDDNRRDGGKKARTSSSMKPFWIPTSAPRRTITQPTLTCLPRRRQTVTRRGTRLRK
ncbi:hypothetical protein AB1N83_011736 [Pleurotus pulmonarius]